MNDLDARLLDLLERHYPPTSRTPDWDDVLDRASKGRGRSRLRMLALAAAALACIAIPTLALSASVRDLIFPRPLLTEATLLVSSPIGNGKIARMWASPSSTGGDCRFVTADAADTDKRPARIGAGYCALSPTQARPPPAPPLWAGLSIQHRSGAGPNWLPPIISGAVARSLGAARVELRWRTGAMPLALSSGFFLGGSPNLYRPPFNNLPYTVIAYDSDGREVARFKFASRVFYTTGNGKQTILPKLRDFARQHRDRHINP